jgi:uncharacterized alpha-E superfamily protein
MLARIAQELFWLGRDVARAEHTARMLDGVFYADVAGFRGDGGIALSWDAVLAIIGAKPPAPAIAATDSAAAGSDADAEAPVISLPTGTPRRRAEVVQLLTIDTDSPASIVSCVARARERGKTLRDVISTEMWEALNAFHLGLLGGYMSVALDAGPYAAYQEVKERCALFWGLVDRTMLRDESHSFLEAGGRIDAADMVLRMLRVAVPSEPAGSGHEAEAIALLHAVGGFQAYRRAVRYPPTVGPVARFLLYDSSYPGSVAASVEALHAALQAADAQPRSSPPVLRLGRLIADFEFQRRTPEGGEPLGQGLERVQDELERVDRDIDERFFAPAAAAAVHL